MILLPRPMGAHLQEWTLGRAKKEKLMTFLFFQKNHSVLFT